MITCLPKGTEKHQNVPRPLAVDQHGLTLSNSWYFARNDSGIELQHAAITKRSARALSNKRLLSLTIVSDKKTIIALVSIVTNTA